MRKVIQISFISLFLFLGITSALACQCDINSHRKDFRKAKNIFIGEVISVDFQSNLTLPDEVKDFRAEIVESVKFNIEKSWKGKQKKEIKIWSLSFPSSCGGFRFIKGTKYLVYVFKKDKSLYAVTSCNRTRLAETDNQYKLKEIEELNSFWFRFWAKINPF